jgi:Ca2+-binding RTX toxin-like protein
MDGKAGNDAVQAGAGNDRLTGRCGAPMRSMAGWVMTRMCFARGDGASRSIDINGETAVQVEMVVDEGGVDTLAFDASVDTRTLQLIDNDEGNLLIRYGSQAQAEQGQEGSDLLLVGQGLAGNIEHVQVGAGGTATQLSMTRFIGQYGEGVYRGTDATGHTHLTGGRSADFIVGSNGEEVSGGRGGNDSIVLAGTGSTVHYAVGDGTDRVSTNRGRRQRQRQRAAARRGQRRCAAPRAEPFRRTGAARGHGGHRCAALHPLQRPGRSGGTAFCAY